VSTGGIVLLGGGSVSTRIVYHALAREFPISRVIVEGRMPRARFLRNRTKRLGVARTLGQVVFRAGVVPTLRFTSRARVAEIMAEQALDDSPIPGVTSVESANAEETIALLREAAPKVVVVNGTRILSREVLGCVDARFVNTHVGITPLYRGVHGGYWALVGADREACGVTVHLVDAGIDTGSILAQTLIHPTERDNFVTYPYLQLAAAIPLLRQAVAGLLEGTATVLPPPRGTSRLYSHPTVGEYLYYRLARGVK
jgi:methionyl-tRNA formyltransferase